MNKSNNIFTEEMQEIVESFVAETRELLEELEQDLLKLESNGNDADLINKIFRTVHTIKGTSGFLELEQLAELAHQVEHVLNKLRRGELNLDNNMMDVLFNAFEYLKQLFLQVEKQKITPIDLQEIFQQLEAITTVSDDGGKSAETSASGRRRSGKRTKRKSIHPVVSGSSKANAGKESKQIEEPVHEDTPRPSQVSLKVTDTTIRVSVQRLDNLMNLVGELVLARNRLLQQIENMRQETTQNEKLSDFIETGSQVDFITTELQNAIMKTRMVPVGRVFNRFPRLVRDIAREFSKEIELVIEGADTEVDKSVIEEIGDPLIHLVRNSADHGIESREERRKAGKPERGVIRLSAGHEGNHIVIVVEDDGRGIDPEKIKVSAIKKGFISPEAAAGMSDAEVYNLIFAPGFSTSSKVTAISGRGVGMDVVKTNITRLNGMVSVQSVPGQGTKFFLKLPLTLAIIRGLLVNIGEETFAIPLSSVTEVVRVMATEIYQLQGRQVIRLRERILPLFDLQDGIKGASGTGNREKCYVVVLGVGNHHFGLKVDRLLGQKEIVIKPLGSYLKHINGVAGSTILGDGRVIMILDIGEISKLLDEKISTTGKYGNSCCGCG